MQLLLLPGVGYPDIRTFAAHPRHFLLPLLLLVASIGSLFLKIMADPAVVGFGALARLVESGGGLFVMTGEGHIDALAG